MNSGKGGNTLRKSERIKSKTHVDMLFSGGSRSLAAYPLRVVYRFVDRSVDDDVVKILISVPKRCFKRAVKRNLIKRQVREAYRNNKHSLRSKIGENTRQTMLLAFIWLDDKLYDTRFVEQRVVNLLDRVGEKVDKITSKAKNSTSEDKPLTGRFC